eukprot:Hpha_TRINITY_DN15643_c1_g4::TRINITY_DN15643_c1_g4_i1::g.101243::m.101243/K08493/VTI1; vesicle transport through interaction with t-SNAREs 1
MGDPAQNARMYDDEISDRIDDAEAAIRDARDASGTARKQAAKQAQDDLKNAKKVCHTLQVEIRPLPATQKAQYDKRVKSHRNKIQELNAAAADLLRDEAPEVEAVYGGAASGAAEDDPSRQEARRLAKTVEKHQTNSLQSLDRTNQLIGQTEVVAQDTHDTLQKQGEQLRRIDEQLDELGTDTQRARRELNAFARRLASDRLILCCMFLIVLGGLVAIILHFVMPKDDTGNNGVAPADIS